MDGAGQTAEAAAPQRAPYAVLRDELEAQRIVVARQLEKLRDADARIERFVRERAALDAKLAETEHALREISAESELRRRALEDGDREIRRLTLDRASAIRNAAHREALCERYKRALIGLALRGGTDHFEHVQDKAADQGRAAFDDAATSPLPLAGEGSGVRASP